MSAPRSKPPTKAFDEGYDRIFGKRRKKLPAKPLRQVEKVHAVRNVLRSIRDSAKFE